MAIKTKYSALGAQINCPNFYPCPLCYGCRNYNESMMMCQICKEDNLKYNTCKTSLHKPDILSKMLNSNNKINVKGA